MALASRFSVEGAVPATKPLNVLRRAGLFTPAQASAVMIAAAVMMVGLLMLQKIGVPFGDQDAIQLCLPGAYLAIGFIAVISQKVAVDPYRLLLFGIFATLAIGTNMLSGRPYSAASLIYVIAIYFPFVFRYFVPMALYKRLMNLYINAALVIVGLVIGEHAIQLVSSASAWPDLEKIVPTNFLVAGYNYVQPLEYGSRFMKPNAFFFLEASFVSQFIALGLVVELIFFGRVWRLLALTAGLLLTFAGTGVLLVLACAPFLVFRMSLRVLLAALAVALLTAFAAVEFGWYTQVSHRVTEYQVANSSAHLRFVSPGAALLDFLQRPDALYGGLGAGQIPVNYGAVWWPITKVTVEYGVLTAAAFYVFFLYSLFGDGGHLRMGFALFIFYNFLSGSFAVPVNALTCMFFCTLFRVANPPPPPPRRARRPSTGSVQAASLETPAGEPEPAPPSDLPVPDSAT